MSVELGHPRTRPAPPSAPSAPSAPPVDPPGARLRRDRCPGAVHPWPAADGALVRLRPPGGRVAVGALRALLDVAERHGDSRVHLTGRANLQLRALPWGPAGAGDRIDEQVLAAIEATGLLPSRAHDRARNIAASPCTGLTGGRADLRPVVAALDAALLADPPLAALPGRFWFVLDDGRGDLAEALVERADLGLLALDDDRAQLCVGGAWAAVVALDDAPAALLDLAREFLAVRGDGADAPWHVHELAAPLTSPLAAARAAEPGAEVRSARLPHGPVPGGVHLDVGDGLTRPVLDAALSPAHRDDDVLVVTPWRGLLVPHPAGEPR